MKKNWGLISAGLCAGAVNGLFGAGGGMLLVPMLTAFGGLKEDAVFPSSVSIIAPVCLVSLGYSLTKTPLDLPHAIPYLIGSAAGGLLAGLLGKKIPTLWLHRALGILILWGGVRYLC